MADNIETNGSEATSNSLYDKQKAFEQSQTEAWGKVRDSLRVLPSYTEGVSVENLLSGNDEAIELLAEMKEHQNRLQGFFDEGTGDFDPASDQSYLQVKTDFDMTAEKLMSSIKNMEATDGDLDAYTNNAQEQVWQALLTYDPKLEPGNGVSGLEQADSSVVYALESNLARISKDNPEDDGLKGLVGALGCYKKLLEYVERPHDSVDNPERYREHVESKAKDLLSEIRDNLLKFYQAGALEREKIVLGGTEPLQIEYKPETSQSEKNTTEQTIEAARKVVKGLPERDIRTRSSVPLSTDTETLIGTDQATANQTIEAAKNVIHGLGAVDSQGEVENLNRRSLFTSREFKNLPDNLKEAAIRIPNRLRRQTLELYEGLRSAPKTAETLAQFKELARLHPGVEAALDKLNETEDRGEQAAVFEELQQLVSEYDQVCAQLTEVASKTPVLLEEAESRLANFSENLNKEIEGLENELTEAGVVEEVKEKFRNSLDQLRFDRDEVLAYIENQGGTDRKVFREDRDFLARKLKRIRRDIAAVLREESGDQTEVMSPEPEVEPGVEDPLGTTDQSTEGAEQTPEQLKEGYVRQLEGYRDEIENLRAGREEDSAFTSRCDTVLQTLDRMLEAAEQGSADDLKEDLKAVERSVGYLKQGGGSVSAVEAGTPGGSGEVTDEELDAAILSEFDGVEKKNDGAAGASSDVEKTGPVSDDEVMASILGGSDDTEKKEKEVSEADVNLHLAGETEGVGGSEEKEGSGQSNPDRVMAQQEREAWQAAREAFKAQAEQFKSLKEEYLSPAFTDQRALYEKAVKKGENHINNDPALFGAVARKVEAYIAAKKENLRLAQEQIDANARMKEVQLALDAQHLSPEAFKELYGVETIQELQAKRRQRLESSNLDPASPEYTKTRTRALLGHSYLVGLRRQERSLDDTMPERMKSEGRKKVEKVLGSISQRWQGMSKRKRMIISYAATGAIAAGATALTGGGTLLGSLAYAVAAKAGIGGIAAPITTKATDWLYEKFKTGKWREAATVAAGDVEKGILAFDVERFDELERQLKEAEKDVKISERNKKITKFGVAVGTGVAVGYGAGEAISASGLSGEDGWDRIQDWINGDAGGSAAAGGPTGPSVIPDPAAGAGVEPPPGSIDVAPALDSHTVTSGDTVSEILWGEPGGRDMSEVLEAIPPEHRQAALRLLEAASKTPDGQAALEAAGIRSGDISLIRPGEQLDMNPLNDLLYDIAQREGWLSEGVTPTSATVPPQPSAPTATPDAPIPPPRPENIPTPNAPSDAPIPPPRPENIPTASSSDIPVPPPRPEAVPIPSEPSFEPGNLDGTGPMSDYADSTVYKVAVGENLNVPMSAINFDSVNDMVMDLEPAPKNWAEYRAAVTDILEREAMFREVLGGSWTTEIPSSQLSRLEDMTVNDLLGPEADQEFVSAGVFGGNENFADSFQKIILESRDLGVDPNATIGEALKHLAENYDVQAGDGKIVLQSGGNTITFANDGGVYKRVI